MEASLDEALLETSEKEAATAGEIIAIATTGAAEEPSSGCLIPRGDESFEADALAPLASMDYTSNTRQSKILTMP